MTQHCGDVERRKKQRCMVYCTTGSSMSLCYVASTKKNIDVHLRGTGAFNFFAIVLFQAQKKVGQDDSVQAQKRPAGMSMHHKLYVKQCHTMSKIINACEINIASSHTVTM